MRVKLSDGQEYRLYFRHYHTQSVMVKRYRGKIDYNQSEIRTIKELVATECFLEKYPEEDDDPFTSPVRSRGISIKSPEDLPNKEIARVASIKHMVVELSQDDEYAVWEAYYGRLKGKEGHAGF